MTRASDLARLIGAGGTVANDVTISEGSPSIRLNDTDTSRFIDILYGTRNATFRNTMASGEDMDTVAPEIIFQTQDDGETREHFRMNKSEAVFNEGSVDLDFRVESNGNANMLFVDGGNDKVGIGTASPDNTLHVHTGSAGSVTANTDSDDLVIENNSHTGISILSPDANRSAIVFGHASDNHEMQIRHDGGTSLSQFISDDAITFNVGDGSERMRIDTSGDTFINATSDPTPFTAKFCVVGTGNVLTARTTSSSGATVAGFQTGSYNGGVNIQNFYNNSGGTMGTISATNGLNGTSVSFNTSSDYRLKENVSYNFDATTRLKQLKPARFNFIADETNTPVDGFLAHEVSSIVPEAITGEKDAVDADGNIDPQGIDQSKLVPLLVKTIQELEARITALESK